MHQRIMIGPTADPVEPGLKQFEFAVAKLAIQFLQQEHGGNFFFEHRAGEKLIGNLNQKIEPLFFSHFPPETHGCTPQVRRIPSVRFDFVFEKPLHTRGMHGRTAVSQCTADLGGDEGRGGLGLRHGLPG